MAAIDTKEQVSDQSQTSVVDQAEPDSADKSVEVADEQPPNTRGSVTVAGAHFSHDLYSSFRDPLIPVVQDRLGISLAMASLMVPAQSFPSLLQPFFGVLADRTSKRWFVVLAPAVAGITISSIGIAPNFAIVLLLLFTAGLASAAFHTPAVALMGEYGGSKTGQAMAIFQAGGSLARGLGPLVVTGAIAIFTVDGLWVVMIFGILASIALYFTVDTTISDSMQKGESKVGVRAVMKARGKYIGALLGFGFFRSATRAPFTIFLVALLLEQGRSEWYAGMSLSVIFTAGIAGGFIGGMLSDRFGRRSIMAVSTALLVPTYYLYLVLENGTIWVMSLLALAGVLSMASGPVELALSQDMLPEARGPMAGVILAFRFVTMSIIAFAFGVLADIIGLENAYWIVPAFSVVAVALVPLFPRKGEVLPPIEMPAAAETVPS